MSKNTTWNYESRESLRKAIRNRVLGEVRLGSSDRDDILDFCREVYVEDECPEDERNVFIRFAAEQLEQAAAMLGAEHATWPRETDCDRLDRVEAALRDRGILLWQVSPCCDSCTVGRLLKHVEEIDQRYPGFRERIRGYAFFIDQNMADMLAERTQLSIYLGYGWWCPDSSDVAPDVYEENALGIAQEVCECLRQHGFVPDWNGDFSKKIGVSLDWQRRTTTYSASQPASASVPVQREEGRPWKQCLWFGLMSAFVLVFGWPGSILVVAVGSLVFTDAWMIGIRRKPNNSGFLNISPFAWGVAVNLLPIVSFPLYLFTRDRLRVRKGSTVVWLLLVVLGGLLMPLSLKSNLHTAGFLGG